MPHYVLLSTLTSKGGQSLHAKPSRVASVNKEVKAFGCQIVAQYATLGAYDFVTVIEAPNNETIAHLSIGLSSRGTVKITTLPAIPVTRLIAKLKGPKQMGKRRKRRAKK